MSFSEFFEGKLTTCGQGHIRFWKMASTFTGLKLQGEIGKFGNEELSDIAGYVELPDGKVLSGTESGKLLLWDGGLIKVVLMKPGGKNCHDAMIETITLDLDNKKIVTSGSFKPSCLTINFTPSPFEYKLWVIDYFSLTRCRCGMTRWRKILLDPTK